MGHYSFDEVVGIAWSIRYKSSAERLRRGFHLQERASKIISQLASHDWIRGGRRCDSHSRIHAFRSDFHLLLCVGNFRGRSDSESQLDGLL